MKKLEITIKRKTDESHLENKEKSELKRMIEEFLEKGCLLDLEKHLDKELPKGINCFSIKRAGVKLTVIAFKTN